MTSARPAGTPPPVEAPAAPPSWRDQISERVSLASRITLLTAVAVAITVSVLAAAFYFVVRSELNAAYDESLLQRAQQAAASPQNPFGAAGEQTQAVADIKWIWVARDSPIGVRSGDVEDLVGGPELKVYESDEPTTSIRTVDVDGVPYRVTAARGEAAFTVLAEPLTGNRKTLEALGVVLLVVGIVGVAVAALAGWLVATNGLRPVRRLTVAAEEIARTERLRPIEVTGHDELARLTAAFNAMLRALGESQRRERQLVADAGHELRTPLTSLRTNIDLLSQADSRGGLDPRARAELMADVRAQLGELTTLIGDLVELARDDLRVRTPEEVDLADVVEAAVARVRRRATNVEIEVDSYPWIVLGDPQQLERALTNLLDNAVKWSPPLGTVRIRSHDGTVVVTDDGPGIADTDLPHVFERFYRSREARTLPGSGLGLAIVAQAAHRHGGEVQAGRAPTGGAQMTLTLPGRPAGTART